ncbi:hypothetical protein ACFC3F_04185 [Microbacterium sp. NPDC055910]|uniref:hypothetical protein n=1 Tax=Microbacterium sp. NPDC055910 TaxID=3345659 RepID=UPI0035E34849
MSTDTRRGRSRARRGRAFLVSFVAVVAALAVAGAGAAAIGVVQGPRITDVQVDPAASVAASGSRIIVTTSQSLAEVDPAQVTVTPETPFAVDTSGRSVGVRFGVPLRDDTEYTVTIDGVRGLGGGPDGSIVETFRTPPIAVHLLQRGGPSDDTIFRTDLTGDEAVPVFSHPDIEDFRATASQLVVSVRTADDRPALLVTDLDGSGERALPLPGDDGVVTHLQAADRGDLIGFTYSDATLSDAGGLESALFTVAGDTPTRIEVAGTDARIAQWRFVPETDSILLLTFDGNLLLTGAEGGEATSLGTAISIDGVAGTAAIVERLDGIVVLDLTDGTQRPLVTPDEELGLLGTALPVPGGGTLRSSVVLDETGTRSLGTSVALVDGDGASRGIADIGPTDALMQTCVSPSGRYAAVTVAPDAVDNPYDGYLLPLPERLETRIFQLDDAEPVVSLEGFALSWCRVPTS